MARYILARLWQGLLVVLGVTLVVFVVTRVVGNPVDLMLPLSATAEQRAAFAQQIGLDQPLPLQFARFVGDLVTLDFGESVWQRRPAAEVVFERLPNTMLLIAAGLGAALLLALPLGIIAATRPDGPVDRLIVSAGLLGLSMPQFWVGLILITIFAVNLKWLPTSGATTWAHLILPAVTLGLAPLARLTMLTRSAVIDELNKPYVKTARAKGMPAHRVLGIHALRNVLIGVLTLAGWELILALSGYTVVVETVFAWPGLGLTAIQAIQRGDLFLVQAIVFVIAALIVIINLALDLAFKLIDPRIDVR
ncbi:ABC transporter permease [Acuticoccus sp. MNP-M23]|uniref:ABC transporter permease n=1 Tax=Acuticoccus sp. MNP-M23 TaxID=3072793 RepID=UPI002815BEBE|nr:ABC transporter permease [Acuticoccus sp. MNP-M23]WMS43514.1 ABC transporter permease [Acuticoccus sp. MNP-M23]